MDYHEHGLDGTVPQALSAACGDPGVSGCIDVADWDSLFWVMQRESGTMNGSVWTMDVSPDGVAWFASSTGTITDRGYLDNIHTAAPFIRIRCTTGSFPGSLTMILSIHGKAHD